MEVQIPTREGAVLRAKMVGPRHAQVDILKATQQGVDGGAHWRHLANTSIVFYVFKCFIMNYCNAPMFIL